MVGALCHSAEWPKNCTLVMALFGECIVAILLFAHTNTVLKPVTMQTQQKVRDSQYLVQSSRLSHGRCMTGGNWDFQKSLLHRTFDESHYLELLFKLKESIAKSSVEMVRGERRARDDGLFTCTPRGC